MGGEMTDFKIDYKIARLHQKLASAEIMLEELHSLIGEFRAWLREEIDERRERERDH
ncbi:MAG: hypothetical protein DDT19_00095 [Syntrophomonadaceae bacterium]|nr:hypothetical protein [Bacillota bacterium]